MQAVAARSCRLLLRSCRPCPGDPGGRSGGRRGCSGRAGRAGGRRAAGPGGRSGRSGRALADSRRLGGSHDLGDAVLVHHFLRAVAPPRGARPRRRRSTSARRRRRRRSRSRSRRPRRASPAQPGRQRRRLRPPSARLPHSSTLSSSPAVDVVRAARLEHRTSAFADGTACASRPRPPRLEPGRRRRPAHPSAPPCSSGTGASGPGGSAGSGSTAALPAAALGCSAPQGLQPNRLTPTLWRQAAFVSLQERPG